LRTRIDADAAWTRPAIDAFLVACAGVRAQLANSTGSVRG
jgi:hypothetical protein